MANDFVWKVKHAKPTGIGFWIAGHFLFNYQVVHFLLYIITFFQVSKVLAVLFLFPYEFYICLLKKDTGR